MKHATSFHNAYVGGPVSTRFSPWTIPNGRYIGGLNVVDTAFMGARENAIYDPGDRHLPLQYDNQFSGAGRTATRLFMRR